MKNLHFWLNPHDGNNLNVINDRYLSDFPQKMNVVVMRVFHTLE